MNFAALDLDPGEVLYRVLQSRVVKKDRRWARCSGEASLNSGLAALTRRACAGSRSMVIGVFFVAAFRLQYLVIIDLASNRVQPPPALSDLGRRARQAIMREVVIRLRAWRR